MRNRGAEKDARFVELGEYLCEVRSKQYGRLKRLKSFDEFHAKRFPNSRRKANYLMAIHENLMSIPKQQLREVGWSKATESVKRARKMRKHSRVQPGCARQALPKEGFKGEVEDSRAKKQ